MWEEGGGGAAELDLYGPLNSLDPLILFWYRINVLICFYEHRSQSLTDIRKIEFRKLGEGLLGIPNERRQIFLIPPPLPPHPNTYRMKQPLFVFI